MDAEDFEHEEFGISESVGLAFHGFDSVVAAFQRSGRDGVVVPRQDAEGVETERLGELLEHPNAGRLRVHDPVHQKGFRHFLVVLFPDLVEFFFELIRDGQWFVQSQGFLQPPRLLV